MYSASAAENSFCRSCEQAGGEMGFGILGSELGGFAVCLEGVFRLFIFKQMREREPGACLTFFYVSGGLEGCGGAEKLLGVGMLARTSIRPRLRLDSKTSGLAATDLR